MRSHSPAGYEDTLRTFASHDVDALELLLDMRMESQSASGLAPREYALVKLAGLIGMDASPASFAWQISLAREFGVREQDITNILLTLAPTVGVARVVSCASAIALAMGIAFEDDDGVVDSAHP